MIFTEYELEEWLQEEWRLPLLQKWPNREPRLECTITFKPPDFDRLWAARTTAIMGMPQEGEGHD